RFLLSSCRYHSDLLSFPTRRSSDLRQQVGLVQYQQRLEPGLFGGHQVAVDQVAERLGQGSEDDDQAVDIGRHRLELAPMVRAVEDRKSTRLNSSHVKISYAVFCLKK